MPKRFQDYKEIDVWRNKANALPDLAGADLGCFDLSEADLCGCEFGCADLSEADLRGADLRGANLSEADLFRSNLSRADLGGADLARANLIGAKFSDETKLTGANVYGAHPPEFREMALEKGAVEEWPSRR